MSYASYIAKNRIRDFFQKGENRSMFGLKLLSSQETHSLWAEQFVIKVEEFSKKSNKLDFLKKYSCLIADCSAHRLPTEMVLYFLKFPGQGLFREHWPVSVGLLWAEQFAIKHWAVFSFLKKIRQKSMKNPIFGLLTSIGRTPSPFPLFWDITQLLTLKIVDFMSKSLTLIFLHF